MIANCDVNLINDLLYCLVSHAKKNEVKHSTKRKETKNTEPSDDEQRMAEMKKNPL